MFFVTCGEGAGVFNAYFSKADVESGAALAATRHVDKAQAIEACATYAKKNANHPSTVKFSRVMDMAVTEHPNGRTSVTSTFTAKNSFNLEMKYSIRCLVDATGMFQANVAEVR